MVAAIEFRIGTIFFFHLKVASTKFQANWPFGSEEVHNRFWRWRPRRPSSVSDRNALRYYWSTSQLDTSYQLSNQLAVQFHGGHGGHLRLRNGTSLAIVGLQIAPIFQGQTKFQVNRSFFQEKLKIYFKDGGHLGFWVGLIVSFFLYLLDTQMPRAKFRVNLFDGLRGVVENMNS